MKRIVVRVCVGLLVFIMLSIFLRVFTRVFLMEKYPDSAFVNAVFFDRPLVEATMLGFNWAELYPFEASDLDAGGGKSLPARVKERVSALEKRIEEYMIRNGIK